MTLPRVALLTLTCSALLGTPQAAFAQCDQTLSTGANITAAITSAANGSTICLNNGNYGTVTLTNITRTGFVTVQSVNPDGAQMSPRLSNTDYIKFVRMKLTDMTVHNCSTHIHLIDSSFVSGARGIYYSNSSSCGMLQDLLVHNVSFAGVNLGGNEGRLGTQGPINGLTITNSFFGNNGYGDGIQLGGGTNIVIGPGNLFDRVSQSYCNANGGAHCDAIQLYGAGPGLIIKGNWFKNTDTHIMAPDGSTTVTVEDNVFDMTGTSYPAPVQFGSASSPIFRHNTVKGASSMAVSLDSKVGMPATTSALAENNIMDGVGFKTSNGSGCSSCVFRYNLFSNSAYVRGTNTLLANPSYVGGSWPTVWTGWQLSLGSPGKNAGNDGRDLGVTMYGTAGPRAPTNVRIITAMALVSLFGVLPVRPRRRWDE